jgi:ankyrin repeat protein
MQQQLQNFNASAWGGGVPQAVLKDEDKMLCDACRNGDREAAKKALDNGANASVQFRLALGEITPIFLCASKGYQDIADLLTLKGADIHKKMDFDGTICLHHAASNDQPEMCEWLIKKGCNVNQIDKLGRTPLMDAAEIGSVRCIDVLIKYNANVNEVDKEGHTALSYCLDFINKKEPKFFEAACRLVEKGAEPNYAGKFGNRTLLHIAAAQGNLKLVKQLIETNHAMINCFDNEGKTPLRYAEDNKHQDVITYLQQQHANQSSGCIIL